MLEVAIFNFFSLLWLPTLKKYEEQFLSSDLFVFSIVPQRLTLLSNAKRKISKSNKSEV
jgi:hypothetical protein